MTPLDNGHQVDVTLARYLDALEENDLDVLQAIWKQAESDPALEAGLLEANAEHALDNALPETAHASAAPESVETGRLSALQADLVLPSSHHAEQLVEASYSDYRCRVLVVDDEPYVRAILQRALSGEFEVFEANSVAAAQAVFHRQQIDVLLTDLCLKGPSWEDHSGIELIEWVRQHSPRTVSLLMSGFGELTSVIEAINRGHVFYYLSKPLPKLEPLLETLRRASHAFTVERKNQDLLERLKDMNAELEEKVRRRAGELLVAMHELAQKNKTLEKLALTDALTGLPNRRAMDQLAERELLWRKRNTSPLTIGLVDVDYFKNVNTVHRWSGGDRVLTEVSRCLSASLREIDYLGRYGGEEFMLIAPQADRYGAEALAERLRQKVESTPIHYRGQTIHVTVSIGLAVVEKDGKADLDRMKDACEAALAAAKEQGRNRAVVTVIPAEQAVLARRARG
jgi:diguanylate cyclase (GGDEF)-like protein